MKEHRAKDEATQAALSHQFWPGLFQSFFVDTTACHADDLVILVKKGEGSDPLDVYRRGAKTRPMPEAGNPNYKWEESTCLNLLLQDTTYMLTCAVCSRDPQSKKLKVIRKLSNQVYASPSKRNMESKSADEIITFPLLYFSIDDFDQRFEDVVVAPSECVCVELVAKSGEIRSTMFSGAVTHSQLAASFSSKTGRQLFASKSKKDQKMEFLHMLGPKGLGQAEMAVSISTKKVAGSAGAETGLGSSMRRAFSMVKDIVGSTPDVSEERLNAYLTFVSLSWKTMVENVIENIQPPALDTHDGLATGGPSNANGEAAPNPNPNPC
jgi:hypothetical protein